MDRDGNLFVDEEWTGSMDLGHLDDAAAEGAALRWRQANGRAATRSRRYFVRNRLRYMWVLTFAAATFDRVWVMGQVSEFARRLRGALGGRAFPYWYSPELHPGGHGWHVNFFVPDFLDHSQVAALWGLGFVWVTDFAQAPRGPKGEPLGLCRTPREGWRRAAQYGCKYAQKDWSPENVGRSRKRYEVARGFKPQVDKRWVSHPGEADDLVRSMVPEEDWERLAVWESSETEDWNRPPVKTWRW